MLEQLHQPQPATGDELHDAQIRGALVRRLRAKGRGRDSPVVVEELGLRGGLVRVDLAVVDRFLQGFEIKSDRDTLRRLPQQSEAYGQVFDHCTLVTTSRHLDTATHLIPPWWGVMVARRLRDSVRVSIVRRARRNRAVDPRVLAELIWYADALSLLKHRGGARGFRGKRRDVLWDQICALYELDEIRIVVQRLLKRRARNRSARLRV